MSPTGVKGMTTIKGVPQTLEEFNEALGEYFSVKRRLKNLKTRLDGRIKKIKDQYAVKMRPDQDAEKELAKGIQTGAEAHRAEWTADGTKSKKFWHGTIGWRLGNWYHVFTTTEDDLITELKEKGLYDTYVVIKPEVDIQKLIRDRHKLGDLKSVSFKQDERFYIAEPPKPQKKRN